MAEGGEYRGWDELLPDALGLIFSKLSLREVLTVIPSVCKSWYKVVNEPYCWQEIDIEEWSSRGWTEHIERMLQLLITRSSGSVRKLCVTGLGNDAIFSFIAEHARSLQTLRVPRSEISNSIVEQVAGRFSTITFLDVSYCNNISVPALVAIGKHCRLLNGLRRNMHPLDVAGKHSQDDEAQAIAATMPKLKHLEMAYLLISTASVVEILSSCPDLELLDLRGCWNVKLDDKFFNENFPKLKVLGPVVEDYYEGIDWADCSDFSDSSELLPWDGDYDSSDGMWDDYYEQRDNMTMRMFYGFLENGGYDWPTSP